MKNIDISNVKIVKNHYENNKCFSCVNAGAKVVQSHLSYSSIFVLKNKYRLQDY